MIDYPEGLDGEGQPGGRVSVLRDLDEDGTYDRSTVMVDGFNFPTGVMVWRDGVLITAAPDVLYVRDTDGDDVADTHKKLSILDLVSAISSTGSMGSSTDSIMRFIWPTVAAGARFPAKVLRSMYKAAIFVSSRLRPCRNGHRTNPIWS